MNPPTQEAIRSHRASKAFFAAIFLLIILLLLLSGRNKSAETTQGAVTSTPAQAAAVAQSTQPPTPEPATQPPPTPTPTPTPQPTPVTPTLATPEIDDEGHLVLHGMGEPGATLAIFANGEKLGEVEVGPDGQWSFDAGKLEPGEYLFDIQTLDAAGESVNQTSAPAFTVPQPTPVTPACNPYIVKEDDWLSKLALTYLGDVNAYMKIVEATNAMAEQDPSFTPITDPNRIEPGQKLCIPK